MENCGFMMVFMVISWDFSGDVIGNLWWFTGMEATQLEISVALTQYSYDHQYVVL